MLEDERLEVANHAYFQLIDQLHRRALERLRTACYRHHFLQKVQGLMYLWTAPRRGAFAFAHLLEFPEEEVSTICFIPEQTQLQSDQYYQELQMANRFYTGAKRQLDEAIKHYRQALAKKTTIECLNNIGCALLQSKRLKDAKSHFLSATSLAPRAHEPYHNLAHTQIKMAFSDGLAETELKEQTKAAIKLYEKSLQLNPENHFAWHNIGNIHAANEDYLQAIKFYLEAVSLSPKYASSLCALAHCYRNIREYGNAFEALLPLLKRSSSYSFLVTLANLLVESSTVNSLRLNAECLAGFSEYLKNKGYFGMGLRQKLQLVMPLYEQALKVKPTSSSALTGLGNLHLLMGDYEQALQSYKRAVYFNSRCIAAHNGAALAFYCLRNYALAEVKFEASLNISRSRLSTLLGTFVIRLRLKQTAQAAKIAEELSRLFPQNQLIYYYHSLLLKDATSRKERIKEGLTKKPLFPNNRHLSYKIIGGLMLQFGLAEEAAQYYKQVKDESLLSQYHQQMAQPQKAMDAYIKVLQQNRNNDQALFRIAEACFECNLLESCEAVLVELLKTDRQNIWFLGLLARVKSQQKRHGEEIAICQQIVSLTGESEDALNCLALAHLKQGNLFEAGRCVRLALKKDPRNWAILNNLANISRQMEKHEEARHYYCESQKTGPECFVPFVNSAGLLPLYAAFPPSESTLTTFNLCLHFLFCDQYNLCFREIIKLAGRIADQNYFQMVNALTILQLQFPPFVEYGLLLKFLLSSFCNQAPLFSLQRLLNINESLDGFADAIKSMSCPCDGEARSQILCLMLKQAFAVNQQEALLANHYLCERYKQFIDYSKRKELIFWAKGQVAAQIEQLFRNIESVLSNQEKEGAQSATLKQTYAGINKAKNIRTLIENGSIQASQIEHSVAQAFSVYSAKNGHYSQAFSGILGLIEREQSKLINDLKRSSKDQKKKIFVAYYETTYFVNLFIKYCLHSLAYFIDPGLRITLAEALVSAKCSSKGSVEIMKMVMKELSVKESMSRLSTVSNLKISIEFEEVKKLSRRSEEEVTTKENVQKETSYHISTREERRYSKLSVVFQSSISERWPFPLAQKGPQSGLSALRLQIQFNFDYQSFNLCFCETRQLCQQYLNNHPFLHFDPRQTLMKTERQLDYQQMLELGYNEAFRFIQHFSSAILQLEQHGIYHCDLSLKNVIRVQDTFKVVDFAFVMMLQDKDLHFYESTKKLVGLLIEPKTKQIQETVVRYIFRNSDQAIQSCLLDLGSEQLEPEEKTLSFLANLKAHAIAYNRKLLREAINKIVNTNQQTPKLFPDEITIITQYLNQITNQPHELKKYLQAFRLKCRNLMEQSSKHQPQ